MGIEALVVVSPKIPLVSIGYFQDAGQEVDLQYCKESGIPFMRREVGGGATYLDENQIFYQLIWKKDNPRFPKAVQEIYPMVFRGTRGNLPGLWDRGRISSRERYHHQRQVERSPERAAEILETAWSLWAEFFSISTIKAMSRILKVPDEKFRDKVYKTMEENLTTMKRELGTVPRREEIVSVLKERFEKRVGKLDEASLTPEIIEKMKQLESWMTSEEFLLKKTPENPGGG